MSLVSARLAMGVGMGLAVYFCSLPAIADDVPLALAECRLEHPLNLSSVAARCGTLRVPENREDPKSGTIELNVAVVPALNRRSNAAPLFLLAGGPGKARCNRT